MDIVATIASDNQVVWYESQQDPDLPDDPTKRSFVEALVSVTAQAARDVTVEDLDSDGDNDIISASAGNNLVNWYENSGEATPVFPKRLVGSSGKGPRAVAAGDLTGDGRPDVAAGYAFRIVWYEQGGEICAAFDANDDGYIDGTELSYLARAFGRRTEGAEPWVVAADLNLDGIVNGDDLAILASSGVWGMTTDTCAYTCR
jgi:hypothetical protein